MGRGDPRPTEGKTVLVVDDDPAICGLLEEMLELGGYRVRAAYDGLDALQQLDREPADLVLTDIMMPRLDGLGLAARLRERGAPPVLLMSAAASPLDPTIPFVTKPFDVWDLLRAVGDQLWGEEEP